MTSTPAASASSVAVQLAAARHARALLTLRAHEAAVAMHRDNGDLRAARAAQARVNGFRNAVGKMAFGLRCAEGRVA